MKRILLAFIVIVPLIGMNPAAQEQALAIPANASLLIDGNKIEVTAYSIEGSHYYKLRDLAMALRDTDKGFRVSVRQDYDNDLIQITPTSGATPEADKYQPLGTELQKNDGKSKIAVRNTADCCKRENTADRWYTRNYMINGNIKLTMYKIEGHNYFKLREIAYALDFSLEWEQASGRIQIDTARRYSFTPYKAQLQENSVEIGSVYEHEKPVFISEMPIIAYRAETTEAERCV